MAQTQTMPSAAFAHERCKPSAACGQKVIPVMGHVVTDEDLGLVQVILLSLSFHLCRLGRRTKVGYLDFSELTYLSRVRMDIHDQIACLCLFTYVE